MLYFPQFHSSLQLHTFLKRLDNTGLFLCALSQFKDVVAFTSSPHDMTLISGSADFCLSHMPTTHTAVCAIIDHSCRLTNKLNQCHFRAVSHTMVGGATSFRLCYFLSPNLKPPRYTSVRRNIKSYLDFGTRGFMQCPNDCFISSTAKLPINDINTYVCMKDSWDTSKTIYRRLTFQELCFIFGLSRKFHNYVTKDILERIVPIHLLDSILLPNLAHLKHLPHPIRLELPHFPFEPKGTCLPQVNAFMPHIWYVSSNTSDIR